MSKNRKYYHIIYLDEYGKPIYNCYYDATIYEVSFKDRVVFISFKGTKEFMLVFPLNRIVRIEIQEFTDKEAMKRGVI